ncbi:MAG TPA: GntR family transcriptional regulator [Bryobacteraceae bacterium]|jgi:GntR family transcriptional regulator
MQLLVNPADELPIYRQIMRQIEEAIAGGRLKPGDKLPSHRDLAEQIVVAPLTVKKSYDELEALGFIETQRGRGTFVCATLPPVNHAGQKAQVREAARKLLSSAYLGGLDFNAVVKILKEAERDITQGREKEAS